MGTVSYISSKMVRELEGGQGRLKLTFGKINRSKFVQNLKKQAEENPVLVIMAVASVIGVTAKLISVVGHARGSRAYAKQVNYRINKGGGGSCDAGFHAQWRYIGTWKPYTRAKWVPSRMSHMRCMFMSWTAYPCRGM